MFGLIRSICLLVRHGALFELLNDLLNAQGFETGAPPIITTSAPQLILDRIKFAMDFRSPRMVISRAGFIVRPHERPKALSERFVGHFRKFAASHQTSLQ